METKEPQGSQDSSASSTPNITIKPPSEESILIQEEFKKRLHYAPTGNGRDLLRLNWFRGLPADYQMSVWKAIPRVKLMTLLQVPNKKQGKFKSVKSPGEFWMYLETLDNILKQERKDKSAKIWKVIERNIQKRRLLKRDPGA